MPHRSRYIALDLETTGLDPRADRVIEIGMLVFDEEGTIVETFERLINPGRPIGIAAGAINGMCDADLIDAPSAAVVLPEVLALLDRSADAPLIAHNAAFDAGFLGMEFVRSGMTVPNRPVLDTLPLARSVLPFLRSHRLDRLVSHFGGGEKARHRALADASVVMDLWFRLGGPSTAEGDRVSYPIHDGSQPVRPPIGWERLAEAGERTSASPTWAAPAVNPLDGSRLSDFPIAAAWLTSWLTATSTRARSRFDSIAFAPMSWWRVRIQETTVAAIARQRKIGR